MKDTHLLRDRQTVKLGLVKVLQDLFPDDVLKIAYTIQEGVFCRLVGSILSKREVEQIYIKLNEWIASNSPIEFLNKKDGYFQYKVGNTIINALYPVNSSSSMAEPFNIIPFSTGFIVDFGDAVRGENTLLIPPEKLSAAYDKNQRWLKNINLELVSDVNSYIIKDQCFELISIAEALQEKEISDIADMILQQKRALRVLLISGPSSAGKTTFSKRLSTQLRVNGLKPVPISLDDYFVNREQTPLDKDGNYDFENLEALDLNLLQRHIKQLINGETIQTPTFDFIASKRSSKTKTVHVGPSEILIMEGIHALNPKILPDINRNIVFKIIINTLFGLNVDLINRIPTTEVRLIRRLVRDDRFRGIHPEETFNQWMSVRNGEYNNVFKYQEECDVMFNSSLLYEMNALRPFAESSLDKISKDSPNHAVKERLMNLLAFFKPIDVSKVPFNSILREFIGGSIYYKSTRKKRTQII